MKLFILILCFALLPSGLQSADFKPCPLYVHLQKYGMGIDMTGVWNERKTNKQLKRKGW